ncbi:MAG: hypothetical protein KDD83_23445 [Caldilineaceae bacterium]|nr:hypothetical protein [Caldilineaceae bacterium]
MAQIPAGGGMHAPGSVHTHPSDQGVIALVAIIVIVVVVHWASLSFGSAFV